MNWKALFDRQQQLDQYIQQNHQLERENLVPRKILAFQVELGELANETRCFKFWSVKEPSPHKVILEEFVDGLHFLMSLGLELNCAFESLEPDSPQENLCDQFQEVYRLTTQFEQQQTRSCYRRLFEGFLSLGRRLNLSEEEVMEAYWWKNCINHQRQQQGY
ncbi:MAG: dUTP diphosphatase [Bacillota bacterium]|nr:dUTP diphosphatase [Bacillota bacterium]MDW7676243.1 dUTP diphosphatase [Bacillota bacterium]